jgi:hypothetical protein
VKRQHEWRGLVWPVISGYVEDRIAVAVESQRVQTG